MLSPYLSPVLLMTQMSVSYRQTRGTVGPSWHLVPDFRHLSSELPPPRSEPKQRPCLVNSPSLGSHTLSKSALPHPGVAQLLSHPQLRGCQETGTWSVAVTQHPNAGGHVGVIEQLCVKLPAQHPGPQTRLFPSSSSCWEGTEHLLGHQLCPLKHLQKSQGPLPVET